MEPAVVLFIECLAVLFWFSYMDVSTKKIPNRHLFVALLIALFSVLITGHLIEHLVLHLSAIGFTGVTACVLYRIGAIGGGDLKLLLVVSFLSPGMTFVTMADPVLEAVISAGILMMGMLLLGWLYSWHSTERGNLDGTPMTPLIPFLTLLYVVLQTVGLLSGSLF